MTDRWRLNESPYEKVGKFRVLLHGVNRLSFRRLNESPYEKVGKSVSKATYPFSNQASMKVPTKK